MKNNMANLRRLDAFASKPRLDTQRRRQIITVVAASTAALLFIGTTSNVHSDPRSLHLSTSQSIPMLPLNIRTHFANSKAPLGRSPLRVHVTFSVLECSQLEVQHVAPLYLPVGWKIHIDTF
jgi:hypothetical protein